MPITEFSSRIVVDRYFIRWIKALSIDYSKVKYDTLKFLSIIHYSSKNCPKSHVLILYEHFIDLGAVIPHKELLLFTQPAVPIPENPQDDEISKTAKLAIAATSERPFKSAILTTTPKLEDYKTCKHLQNVKDVTIFAEADAIAFINGLFTEYETNK